MPHTAQDPSQETGAPSPGIGSDASGEEYMEWLAQQRPTQATPEGSPEEPQDDPEVSFWRRLLFAKAPRLQDIGRGIVKGANELAQTTFEFGAAVARTPILTPASRGAQPVGTSIGELLQPGFNDAYDEFGARGLVGDASIVSDEKLEAVLGPRSDSFMGAFAESMTQFAVSFAGLGKITVAGKALNSFRGVKSILSATSRGAVVDFSAFDPFEPAFAELMQKAPIGVIADLGALLQPDEDESVLVARLKRSGEGVMLSATVDVLVGISRAFRARKVIEDAGASAADKAEAFATLREEARRVEDFGNGRNASPEDHISVRQDKDGFFREEVNPVSPVAEGAAGEAAAVGAALDDAIIADFTDAALRASDLESGVAARNVELFHSGGAKGELTFFSESARAIREEGFEGPVGRFLADMENPRVFDSFADARRELLAGRKGVQPGAVPEALADAAREQGHDFLVIRKGTGGSPEVIDLGGKSFREQSLRPDGDDVLQGLYAYPTQLRPAAGTSINSSKLPAVFNKLDKAELWEEGTRNFDIGGGKFDNASEFLRERGVENHIYDPFNRSRAQNAEAVRRAASGQSDTSTISNVLNVIEEEANQLRVLQQADDALRDGGRAFITVYEGSRSGLGAATKKGFQHNKKLADYLDLVKRVFPDAHIERGTIVATKRADNLGPDALRPLQGPKHESRGLAEAGAATKNDGFNARLSRNLNGALTQKQAAEVLSAARSIGRAAAEGDVDAIARIADGTHFNFSYFNESNETLAVIEGISEVFRREIDAAQRAGGVPVEKTIEQARRAIGGMVESEAPKRIAERLQSVRDISVWLLSADMVMKDLGRKIARVSHVLDAEGWDRVAHEEMRRKLDNFLGIAQELAGANSEMGRGLRILQERGRPELKDIAFVDDAVKAADDALKESKAPELQAGKAQADVSDAGKMTAGMNHREVRVMARMIRMGNGEPRNIFAVVRGANVLRGGGRMKQAQELFVNSLLSGPKTQAVVISSGLSVSVFEPIVRVLAGLGTGNKALAREGADLLYGLGKYSGDGLKSMAAAFRAGRSIINPFPQIKAIGGVTGEVVRLPTRVMIGLDEFIRTTNYRSFVRSKALREGRALGKDGDALQAFAHETVEGSFDKETGAAIYRQAAEYAEVPTFAAPLPRETSGGALNRMINTVPGMKFIAPFVRASVNLLKYAGVATPGVNLLSKNVRNTLRAGGEDAAIIHARSAFTGVFLGWGFSAYMGDNLTGRGPKDPTLRATWKETHEPYSIRVGGKWIPYARIDPLAAPLGILADILDSYHALSEEHATGRKDLSQLLVALANGVTTSIANKSYLTGITEFSSAWADDNPWATEKWLANLARGFVPFSSALGSFNPDDYYRETRGMLDQFMSRIPGLSETLPPSFNLYGEPELKTPGLIGRAINPFNPREAKEDPVADALLDINKGLAPHPPKLLDTIDLLDAGWKQRDDQELPYVRLMELIKEGVGGAPGMREQLTKLVRSPEWKTSSPGTELNPGGVRFAMAAATKQAVELAAKERLFEEYPRLRAAFERTMEARGHAFESAGGPRSLDELFKGIR